MKATGMIRRVDELGRVVIPKEIRRTHEIGDSEPLEIFVNGQDIILRKYQPGCQLCGSMVNVSIVANKRLCHACVTEIAESRGVTG